MLIFAARFLKSVAMVKEKEPVVVRYKKLANGNKSIYFDIYVDGKRSYEFLKLYLLPEEGRGKAEARRKNKETMDIVYTIKAKRILDIKNQKTGMRISYDKVLLLDWIEDFKKYKAKTAKSEESMKTVDNMMKHLAKFLGEKKASTLLLKDVDKELCENFIRYLKTATKRGGRPLSAITQKVYLTCFGTALNKAVRDEAIPINPLTLIDSSEKIHAPDSSRVYLDIDEVKKMADTECYSILTKQAFMFSIFSGLRISDIRKLRWKDIDIVTDENGIKRHRLTKIMEKTQRMVSFILSDEAVKWLPKKEHDLVFYNLVKQANLNAHIKDWAAEAGITKNVSFHTARHTFATMMLTLGADVYTTSKLLGHSRISTTEIYAKIIDKKKDEAVSLIDKYFN